MDYHSLDGFSEKICVLEAFFTEFAAREDEILAFGVRCVSNWDSYKKSVEILKRFETDVHEFLSFLRPIDKNLYDRVLNSISDSKLVESMAGIEVALRISAQRRKLSYGRELMNALTFHSTLFLSQLRKRSPFPEEIIPVQQLLIALGRLKNFVMISKDIYIRQWSHDSDVFKPSNLEEEKVISYIEEAIRCIETYSPLSKEDKRQLLEYLCKAKSEFSEDRRSWNRIVGALVIAAAITSGIADASGAFQNIDAAIKYILGTSIEKYVPTQLPLLEEPQKSGR